MKIAKVWVMTGLVSLLTACGGGSDCNLLGGAVCDSSPAVVNVAPVAQAGPNQSVLLSDPAVQLDGSGSSDANRDQITYQWTFLSRPAGSAAVITGPTTVKPTFIPDVAGGYVLSLVVSDGKLSSTPSLVTVTASVLNVAPVAHAGANQNVLLNGPVVQLDGSGSSDANRDEITYQWTFLSRPAGSAAVITGSTTVKPTFIPDVAGGYVLSLVVSDGKLSSTPSLVTVTASVQNVAPVAHAGANMSVLLNGNPVQLDGSSSSDANGDGITYQWSLLSKPAGSAVVLGGATAVRPSWTPDVVGNYVFSLTVSDGRLTSMPSLVNVLVSQVNAPPVANAGPDQSVLVNTLVTLDGRDSSDANPADRLTFSWSLSRPDGTSQTLTGVRPTFTAALTGVYTAALTVSDGSAVSGVDQVRIQVSPVNAPPVAVITALSNVAIGSLVQLSGIGSTDSNRDELTYKWSLLSKPTLATGATANSAAVLSKTDVVNPTFTADVAGLYVLGLMVNDGKASSDIATAVVTTIAANVPPVANAGPEQTVAVAAVVTLDGRGSTDANGDTLTYQWTLTTRPNGSAATLTDPTTAQPSFTADVAGFYVATLTVSDGKGGSHVSRVLIKVE